ncbi:50S ribosomal protein L18 [uncultured Gimesia sp.]|uniref:50S ribosomal protein L18 n=1 Tax=uncultured Gimesia sp. TaxID=1678688 RepID=UPI002612A4BD|nr:50S ribosomal protein L18 [uncultured Gimesia sp.]
MKLEKTLKKQKQRREFRIRKAVRNAGRYRLSVYRSNNHIYAQLIDDTAGVTLVSASTQDKSIASEIKNGGNIAAAEKVGKLIGERAVEKGIKEVAFDRGSFRYHGRVAALADSARQAGLDF